MNSTVRSTNLIKWQRFSILALLLALLITGSYSSCQLRRARSEAALANHRAETWREEAARSQALLQKERDITEGLKSCMTFDQTYIQETEGKLARYETANGKRGSQSSARPSKP
jgi:hypothetical protein